MLSVCRQSRMRRNTKRTEEESGFWQGQGSSVLLRWNRMKQHVAETLQVRTASRDQHPYNLHQCQPGSPIPDALRVPIADPEAAPLGQFSTSSSIAASSPHAFFPVRELRIT